MHMAAAMLGAAVEDAMVDRRVPVVTRRPRTERRAWTRHRV